MTTQKMSPELGVSHLLKSELLVTERVFPLDLWPEREKYEPIKQGLGWRV